MLWFLLKENHTLKEIRINKTKKTVINFNQGKPYVEKTKKKISKGHITLIMLGRIKKKHKTKQLKKIKWKKIT